MDSGAWWATVHAVAKSQTGLKQVSTQACDHIEPTWVTQDNAPILWSVY